MTGPSSPQVIDISTGVVTAVAVDTTNVAAVSVILGPPGPAGPAGPAGPQGPAGESGRSSVTRNFAAASSTWEYEHDLGFQPVVTLYDAAGQVLYGDIEVNTATSTRVSWFYPIAGTMTLL